MPKQKDERKYCILLVEDNPGDELLIRDFIDEFILDAQIVTCSTFAELKENLDSSPCFFNVILLDLTLHDKSGLELIASVADLKLELPVIVLTGFGDESFAIKSLAMGMSDYLLKDDLTAITLYKSIVYSIERNKIHNTLRESEIRYAQLFQSSPLSKWVVDDHSFKIIDVNDATLQLLEFTRDEFLLKSHPEFSSELIEECNSDLANQPLLKKMLTSDGRQIDVEIRFNSIFLSGKKHTIFMANNVTERLRYLNAIESQNNALREIAWTQSHVVRAPLVRLMALTDILKGEEVTNPETKQLLEFILQSTAELDAIIHEIVKKSQTIIP